ncbi:MAG: hypothetical protein DRQ88_03100 [Epsilonproteobacteria bacterium]|nr:MAG: hypothetical protein DRQ89_02055 [Campylobacterota bacterium]RLA67459.1 MAG: hypothetical protein DRQ88_03100 [Campylobacterota bacterium]
MDQKKIEDFAQQLDKARKFNCPIVSKMWPINLEEAQSIQAEGLKLRQTRGEIIMGLKIEGIGDTQELLWGYLTNQMTLIPGCKFSKADSIMPKIRPHLAIFIDCQLGENVSQEEVLNASSGISVALEILDSRFDSPSTIEEEICDNFSTSYYLVGNKRVDPKEVDLKGLSMKLQIDEFIAASKTLAEDPLGLISTLLNQRGMGIPAGMVILIGIGNSIDLTEGMNIALNIESLGDLSLSVI